MSCTFSALQNAWHIIFHRNISLGVRLILQKSEFRCSIENPKIFSLILKFPKPDSSMKNISLISAVAILTFAGCRQPIESSISAGQDSPKMISFLRAKTDNYSLVVENKSTSKRRVEFSTFDQKASVSFSVEKFAGQGELIKEMYGYEKSGVGNPSFSSIGEDGSQWRGVYEEARLIFNSAEDMSKFLENTYYYNQSVTCYDGSGIMVVFRIGDSRDITLQVFQLICLSAKFMPEKPPLGYIQVGGSFFEK